MSITLDGTNGITTPDLESTGPISGTTGTFSGDVSGANLSGKNRIINGAMVIAQRNAGASLSVSSDYIDYFPVDRTRTVKANAGVFSISQSTSAPAGFNYSTKAQVTTADASVAAGDFVYIAQDIEGYNVADLGFGATGASTITVSFWVKSSLTGTYGAVIINSTGNRSFVSNYTINAADTWEQKTITVAGDTSGSWLKTNGRGLTMRFGLMVGSTFQQAAGSWGAGNVMGSSSNVNWMATLNNDFYITGVQLEKGSTATDFEYRQYGTELALCQRYYQLANSSMRITATASTQYLQSNIVFAVPMRAVPTSASISVAGSLNVGTVTVTADGSVRGARAEALSSAAGDAYDLTHIFAFTSEL